MLKHIVAAQSALLRNDKGVTAIEYGLIAGLVAIVIIVALTAVGGNLTTKFQDVANALSL